MINAKFMVTFSGRPTAAVYGHYLLTDTAAVSLMLAYKQTTLGEVKFH